MVAGAGNMPMPIRVQRPTEVGADRLVNGVAVARLYGTPAIVVDFGTATTFDCVARDGAYVGGAIAPGLELGARGARLAHRPAAPHRAARSRPKAIGTDTVSAMQSGVVLGYRALTLGLLERIRPNWPGPRRSTPSEHPGRPDRRPLGARPGRGRCPASTPSIPS